MRIISAVQGPTPLNEISLVFTSLSLISFQLSLEKFFSHVFEIPFIYSTFLRDSPHFLSSLSEELSILFGVISPNNFSNLDHTASAANTEIC